MDDLDHSMHISNHDWLSFFEESEECCLLQPSLACPDSPGLSDGEDLDFKTLTHIPLNEQLTGEERKEVVEEEDSCVVCAAEEESKVVPMGSDPKPEPELLVMNCAQSCTEKERWFVTVYDNPAPQLEPYSDTVVKKKQNKTWKDKQTCGKDHTCGNIDMTMQLRAPEELCSDINTGSLETELSTTSLQLLCKGEGLHHLDVGSTSTKQRKNIKSSVWANTNQPISPGTKSFSDNHLMEQNMDLACLEISYEDSTLHFAIENRSEPTKIKCDTGVDLSKCMNTSDTMFIQEEDPDTGHESSQTKPTMDLTGTGDSSVVENLHTSKSTKSTCFEFDITAQADFGHIKGEICTKKVLKELNMDLTCLHDSCKAKFEHTVIDNNTNGSIVEKETTNNNDNIDLKATHRKNPEIGSESSTQEDQRYSGACSLDLASGSHAESTVDTGKPTDNPVSHTNSPESDEFADVEFVSSSSYDSESYHSATESMEDPWHRSIQNSPCNVSISINGDSFSDRGMHSCLQPDSSPPHIETSQIFPSANPGVDKAPNDISTFRDGIESAALDTFEDTPTSAGSSSRSLEGQPESLLQLDATMESPEAYAKATGNSQPVYAISAFWDEMEKLTINDILHIRMGRCMLPVEEAPHTNKVSSSYDIKHPTTTTPESAVLDPMDTTSDSDYCTNIDESKPDRSSCDFSTSDFEEEYWQFLNSSQSSSPDLHDKNYQSQCTDYVSAGEEESDETGTPISSEDCSAQTWSCKSTFGSDDVVAPHKMRKTKSMYDVHALKAMEDSSSQTFLDQSSCKSLVSLNISDGFEAVSPIMCHADEHIQISFPKVFEYLYGDNKAKCEVMSLSVYGMHENRALPINDYTFCTTINDLPLWHYKEEPIPIFSCSRPTVRELTFPKPGCIFLGTNYSAMKDVSPIQILSKSIMKSMDCKQSDRAFCFSQDLSSLYSVKSICFLDKGSDIWRYQSEGEGKPVEAIDSSITVVGEGGVYSITPQMFKEAALRQISMENNQIPSEGIFSTIKQSDMCLVCIAFASWVLRSSDPEAADAWKAALLANVSALSAIQYLRQYMKKRTSPQDE